MTRQDPARLLPRLASLIYESFLLAAILFVASYLFLAIARDAQAGLLHAVFQLYLLLISALYFCFCWVRGGQTLAMKAWRLKLVTGDGHPLRVGRALTRFAWAVPSTLTGLGLLWALFDEHRQFLHDRLAGTRIIREQKTEN